MATTRARTPYELGETFYVPRFVVKVKDRKLPNDVVADVISVTYRDKVEEIDHFDLLVNNWDADRRRLKYEPPSEARFDGIFDPGQRVELYMGYSNDLRLMLTGEITSLAHDFPASGGPTLAVGGLNVLHHLLTEQHSHSWKDMSDTDIAKEICSRPVRKGRPGLGIHLDTDPVQNEERQKFVLMENQHDVVFLLQRARRHDYELVLYEGTSARDRRLYFGRARTPQLAPLFRLDWGRTLISFRPTVATSRQHGAVEAKAWDRTADAQITSVARWDHVVESGPARDQVSKFAYAFDQRTHVVHNRPVHSQQELDSIATSTMRKQLQGLVTGAGSTVGLPGLRAGTRVELTGLGRRFDGTWYVTDTTHTIGAGGYQTNFTARLDLA